MGHSFGGAFTQILLDRGLGAAGVAIDSAAVKGVLTLPWSTLKSAFPVLKSPANNNRAVALSLEEFRYAFTNTLTEESQAAYERYAVPGGSSSRLLWRTSTHAPQLVSTSTTTTAHLCCSLPGGRTTSAPLRLTGPTPSVISSPRQSRCTRSFLSARISRWARRAGSRSPTTPSPGPSRTLLCTRYGGEQR